MVKLSVQEIDLKIYEIEKNGGPEWERSYWSDWREVVERETIIHPNNPSFITMPNSRNDDRKIDRIG